MVRVAGSSDPREDEKLLLKPIYIRNLKRRMKEKGWTQKQLAEKAGVNEKTIARAMIGRYLPRAAMQEKIAVALGCLPQDMLTVLPGEEIPEKMEKTVNTEKIKKERSKEEQYLLESFGYRLHKKIIEQGLTYGEFARMMQMHQSSIRNWIKGEYFPTKKRREQIARCLDIPEEELFQGFEDLFVESRLKVVPQIKPPQPEKVVELAEEEPGIDEAPEIPAEEVVAEEQLPEKVIEVGEGALQEDERELLENYRCCSLENRYLLKTLSKVLARIKV